MLLSKDKITEDIVDMLMKWRHSGFNVFCGPKILPGEEKAMENLARYIIRASFSQERITYIPEEATVVYKSKDGKQKKDFDVLEPDEKPFFLLCSNSNHMECLSYLNALVVFKSSPILHSNTPTVLSRHSQ